LTRRHNLTETAFRKPASKPGISINSWPEIETDTQPGSEGNGFGKLLRATLLICALAVVVGLITWKLTRPRASAEEMFAQAKPLMQSGNHAEWERAWSEYLEPM